MREIRWQEEFDSSFVFERRQLLELLRRLAYEERPVTLRSGRQSAFYIDCKQAVLTAEGHFLAGRLIIKMLKKLCPEVKAVGGLTMGADPLASAAAALSYRPGGRVLDAFYIRKEPKPHGTSKWIEGDRNVPPGTKVAIVEDVITTGASTIKAIERSREHGLDVRLVMAIVDRNEESGRENVEALGAPMIALFNQPDFRPTR